MSYVYAGQYSEVAFLPNERFAKGAAVSVFLRGTSTLATLYTSRTKAGGAANPTTVDSLGNLTFFADPGSYDVSLNGGTFPVAVYTDAEEVVVVDPETLAEDAAFTSTFFARADRNYVDFDRDYAPASDVVTATASLVAAVTVALAANKPLVIRKRRYLLSTVVNLFTVPNLRIIGDGPEDSVFYNTSASYMFDIRGGVYDTTHSLLTVNAAAGDVTLTMASTARLTAGQYANVQSTEIWDATSGKSARYGEIVRIKTIDSATAVTLYQPLDYAYTTANAGKVNYLPLGKGITIKGIGFVNDAPLTGTGGAVVLRYTNAPVIEDITGVGLDGPLLSLDACVDPSVIRANGRDMADDEANDRYGYVVSLGPAVRGAIVSQGRAFNCRHYVTTATTSNAVAGGVPVHNTVVGCQGTGFTNAVFDTHEEGDDTLFVGCRAYNTQDIGFHARAPRTRFENCAVDGAMGTGFLVRSTAVRSVLRGVSAHNLTGALSARSNATNGCRILAPETVLDGFDFRNTGDSGLVIAGNRQQIRNGYIYNAGVTANPQGVRFNAASIDHTLENIFVDGAGGGTAFYASGFTVTGLKASNLRSRSCSVHVNNLVLETEMVNNTAAGELVSKSPEARTTSAVKLSSQWKSQDQGFLAWSYDPVSAVNSSIITSGTLYTVAVWVYPGTYSTVSFLTVTAAASLTSAFVALYHGTSKALLASSVSAATITEFQKTNTAIDQALATPLVVTTPQLIRVGWYTAGGTAPTLARSTNSNITNHGLAAADSRYSTANTGLTTALPDPHTTLALSGVGFWVGVK